MRADLKTALTLRESALAYMLRYSLLLAVVDNLPLFQDDRSRPEQITQFAQALAFVIDSNWVLSEDREEQAGYLSRLFYANVFGRWQTVHAEALKFAGEPGAALAECFFADEEGVISVLRKTVMETVQADGLANRFDDEGQYILGFSFNATLLEDLAESIWADVAKIIRHFEAVYMRLDAARNSDSLLVQHLDNLMQRENVLARSIETAKQQIAVLKVTGMQYAPHHFVTEGQSAVGAVLNSASEMTGSVTDWLVQQAPQYMSELFAVIAEVWVSIKENNKAFIASAPFKSQVDQVAALLEKFLGDQEQLGLLYADFNVLLPKQRGADRAVTLKEVTAILSARVSVLMAVRDGHFSFDEIEMAQNNNQGTVYTFYRQNYRLRPTHLSDGAVSLSDAAQEDMQVVMAFALRVRQSIQAIKHIQSRPDDQQDHDEIKTLYDNARMDLKVARERAEKTLDHACPMFIPMFDDDGMPWTVWQLLAVTTAEVAQWQDRKTLPYDSRRLTESRQAQRHSVCTLPAGIKMAQEKAVSSAAHKRAQSMYAAVASSSSSVSSASAKTVTRRPKSFMGRVAIATDDSAMTPAVSSAGGASLLAPPSTITAQPTTRHKKKADARRASRKR